MKTYVFLGLTCLFAATTALLLSGCDSSARVVDAQDGEITISTALGEEETLTVTPETKITLDGQPAELEDIDAGDSVSVFHDADDAKIAETIEARSKEKNEFTVPDSSPEPVPPNHEPNSAGPEDESNRTLPGPAPSVIEEVLPDVPSDPSAGGPNADEGDSAPSNEAKAAQLPKVAYEGRLVDATDGELTLVDEEGAQRSFNTSAKTVTTIDGEEADLGELRSGFAVEVMAESEGDSVTATQVHATTAP